MNTTQGRGSGIPRLQELSFLEVTAKHVASDDTFDEIRRALIDHMASLRDENAQTGNIAIYRLARHEPYRYYTNAAEALAELMRLGMVEKNTLPSSVSAVPFYEKRRFALTPKGADWVAKLNMPS